MDPRFKLLALALLSAAAATAAPAGLGLLSLLAACPLARPCAPRLALRAAAKGLLPLFGLVLAARGLSAGGGDAGPWPPLTFGAAGLAEGALVCWRLALVALFGLWLAAATSAGQIRSAAAHLLRPLPFLPADRIAAILGLAVQLIPLAAEALRGTVAARQARSAGRRGNPLSRIAGPAIPALRRLFLSADQLALAMEARLYREDRPLPRLQAGAGDWGRLLLAAAVAAGAAAL
jgi:energy-coupling factor transporter transmembrane protein EcfT